MCGNHTTLRKKFSDGQKNKARSMCLGWLFLRKSGKFGGTTRWCNKGLTVAFRGKWTTFPLPYVLFACLGLASMAYLHLAACSVNYLHSPLRRPFCLIFSPRSAHHSEKGTFLCVECGIKENSSALNINQLPQRVLVHAQQHCVCWLNYYFLSFVVLAEHFFHT